MNWSGKSLPVTDEMIDGQALCASGGVV